MKLRTGSAILALFLLYCGIPKVFGDFSEEFGPGWEDRWEHSKDTKYEGRFEVGKAKETENPGLKVTKEALHYGLTTVLDEPMVVADGITLQYEAKWASGHTCGGGYLKFFTHVEDFTGADMVADTPYSIMFGPDKCGGTNKVHFIFRHKSPVDGEYEEKHMESPPSVPSDKLTHVYTATIKTDNTIEILIDGKTVKEGSLFDLFSPPINPPKEIPDPSDVKPEDWVDDAKIADTTATKPDDWVDEEYIEDELAEKPDGWLDDEPEEIEDPSASMPEEWDVEEDGDWLPPVIKNPNCEAAPGCGEWKRPMIPNPEYQGEWQAPMIDNPDYKGEWVQKMIPNPKYFEDNDPLGNVGDIGAVGIEIWTMDKDVYFDNILVANDPAFAEKYREAWSEKHDVEEAVEEEKRQASLPTSSIGETLQNFLDQPALEFAREYLQPIVDYAHSNESLFIAFSIAALMTTLFIFLLLLCKCCCKRKSLGADIRASKKEDKAEPDDSDDSTDPQKKAAGKKSQDEDETTGKSDGPTRRRTRREES